MREGISRVCVVDSGRSSLPRVGETIPPDTRLLLQELGVWEGFVAQRHEACLGSCSAWGSDALGYNDIVLNAYGRGWHLDRRRFDALLARSVVTDGAHLVVGSTLRDCEPDGDAGFRLHLSGAEGRTSALTARIVVDATGSRAGVARGFGARAMFLDRLAFVYGFFDASAASSSSRMTMLEAVETGWWYAARLPDSRLAVAFATDPDIVQRDGLANAGRWFARALRTRHIAPRLDGCRFLAGSLAVRLAPSFLLDTVAADRWLAVGDAAAAYDPLSSQGIYKALADGIHAARVIAARLRSDVNMMAAYETAIADRFEDYRISRNYFYGIEARWAGSPFWRRRRNRTDLQQGRS